MDHEKIVKAVVEKLKIEELYNVLLSEKIPEESEKKFRDFLANQDITEKEVIQEVLSDLKLKKLFNDIFEFPNMEKTWQKMKNDFGLRGFVFRFNT